jgi:tetratricopeptide (TPR) repeat protein
LEIAQNKGNFRHFQDCFVTFFFQKSVTATDRMGAHERLVDYFKAVLKPSKVEKLEDLAPVIELYHHMVRAGKYFEAIVLFQNRLRDAVYYQLGGYQLQIELLSALFVDGENKSPKFDNEDKQASALNELANAYSTSGQPRRAVLLFEQAIKLGEAKGDKKNLAIRLSNVADDQLKIGALNAAERNLRRAIELDKELESKFDEACDRLELGRVLSYRSAWQEAEQELDKSLELAEKQKNVQMQGVIWSYCALRFLLMAREEAILDTRKSNNEYRILAIECAQRALELADETAKTRYPHSQDYVRAYWLLGSSYGANNELEMADKYLLKAITVCRQINAVVYEADSLLDIARLRYAQGDFKDVQEKTSEALVITWRSGYALQRADVYLFLTELALAESREQGVESSAAKEKARKYAERALELAYCDGPPYTYKVAYEEAERMLEKLNKE